MLEAIGMNQLIHTTSPTLVLHQLGWGIPHAMWRNHAYAFYLNSITNSNGNTKFSLAWTDFKRKNSSVIPRRNLGLSNRSNRN